MMMVILDVLTAIMLNVIFHAFVFHRLETTGPIGIAIAIVLTFFFAAVFLVSIGMIKPEEKTITT